jgi:DHA2 family multidrug resistance protein
MLLTPLAAALSTRGKVDPRLFIACGFLLLGTSNLMLASITTPQTQFWTFFWSLALSGFGLAQIFVPLTLSVLGSVGPADIPGASAFFNLSRQIGGSVAIAVLITILARSQAIHHAELASDITLRSGAVAQYLQHNGGARASAPNLNALVDQQAIVLAYADTARATAVITFLLAPCVLLMRRPKQQVSAHAE